MRDCFHSSSGMYLQCVVVADVNTSHAKLGDKGTKVLPKTVSVSINSSSVVLLNYSKDDKITTSNPHRNFPGMYLIYYYLSTSSGRFCFLRCHPPNCGPTAAAASILQFRLPSPPQLLPGLYLTHCFGVAGRYVVPWHYLRGDLDHRGEPRR